MKSIFFSTSEALDKKLRVVGYNNNIMKIHQPVAYETLLEDVINEHRKVYKDLGIEPDNIKIVSISVIGAENDDNTKKIKSV